MKKKLLTCLLALVLLYNTAIHVSAAHPVPDLTDNGSITFEMVKNGLLLDGGSLNLSKVGNIQSVDGDYIFVLVDELKGNQVDLSDPTDHEVAAVLLKLAKDYRLTKQTTSIVKGKATFAELPVGLYLVWQDKGDATKGYTPIHPFLISIPQRKGDQYIQDIVAKPKVPLETQPTVPPSTPPPPPYLPQTGQLNWPVPVLAGAGCVLFALGLLLYGAGKRSEDEA